MEEGKWCTREVREGYGVGLWKEIRKEGFLMFKNIVVVVGFFSFFLFFCEGL